MWRKRAVHLITTTLSHQAAVMDSELKSATSERRAPDDSSGAVKKVVLDMETLNKQDPGSCWNPFAEC